MKLYLICEDIDLGYHVHGVFTDKTVAETQIKLLKKAKAKVRFFDQEMPENYEDYFTIYIEEYLLDDLSTIESLIKDQQRYLELRMIDKLKSYWRKDTLDLNDEYQNPPETTSS